MKKMDSILPLLYLYHTFTLALSAKPLLELALHDDTQILFQFRKQPFLDFV